MSSSTSTPGADVNGSAVANVFVASIVSIVVSSVFFLGRLISKRMQRGPFNASDYTLFVGVACTWGLSIVDMWMTSVGLGKHFKLVEMEDPTLSGVKLMLKVFILDEVFYDVGISSVKISILLLYRGLFPGPKFDVATKILMGVVVAWCLGNLLPSIFSCRPISGFWDITMTPPPVCINKTVLYVVGSTINIATDLAILTLPIGKVIHLQMHRRTKIALIFVFLLGGIVCVVSIYRFTVLFRSNSPDLTWEFANVLNWTTGELATAVASACLPVMRPLAKAVLPGLWMPSTADPHTLGRGTAASKTTAKHKNYLLGRSDRGSHFGSISEFERLPETVSTVAESDRHGQPTVRDIENGYKTDDGILVTKTFEMMAMGREGQEEQNRR